MQACERHRISTIGLNPLAWLLRNQRWCNDRAVMPESRHLAIQSVSGRTGFVADVQLPVTIRQLADRLLNSRRRAIELANIPNLPVAPAIGNRQCMLLLGCVQPDECFAIFFMVRPPCMRLGSVRPSNPRNLYCTKGWTTDLAADG